MGIPKHIKHRLKYERANLISQRCIKYIPEHVFVFS